MSKNLHMDPALYELAEGGDDEEIVEALMRLVPGLLPPEEIRVVCRHGDIASVRMARGDIETVRGHPSVASLKAPRLLSPTPDETEGMDGEEDAPPGVPVAARRPAGLAQTGRGVVVGVIDWGVDFVHPNFRHADGSTRLLALWDQRGPSPDPGNPYGKGIVYGTEAIDQALGTADPYAALGYHPADADSSGKGSHGTHVLDIAAGNGHAAGGPCGVAPGADLIFVHLASSASQGLATLGDSVSIFEAVDFVAKAAGNRPWVVNLSMGAHGGPHDGSTLVELGLDAILAEADGRAVVQSTGNYFSSRVHASGKVRDGETVVLPFVVSPTDTTANEIEIWYDGRTRLTATLIAPDDRTSGPVNPGERREILNGAGNPEARIYNRARDPNNGDNHIDAFLYPGAAGGTWRIAIEASGSDATYHAWMERDQVNGKSQLRFFKGQADPRTTTGTIAHGRLPVTVGAYDATAPDHPFAVFSSSGPTRDSRQKPEIIAPGVRIVAARSAPARARGNPGLLTSKSGTSMAAPHVTGTVALMLEAAGRALGIHDIRAILSQAVSERKEAVRDPHRQGWGELDISAAVARAAANRAGGEIHAKEEEMASETHGVTENSIERANFVMVSGGPGLYDSRDTEHDVSWANYVTPPLVASRDSAFVESFETPYWFIYRPAYVKRFTDDASSTHPDRRAAAAGAIGGSYVTHLEHRAKERGWNLVWFDTASELWRALSDMSAPISRLYYWGHGAFDLWLKIERTGQGSAKRPQEHEILKTGDIGANTGLRGLFQASPWKRRCRFYACNSHEFAQAWSAAYGVESEGYEGTVSFRDILRTVHPVPTQTCVRRFYDATGKETGADSISEAEGLAQYPSSFTARVVPASPETFVRSPQESFLRRADGLVSLEGTNLSPHGILDVIDAAPSVNDGGLFESISLGGRQDRFRVIGCPGGRLSENVRSGDILVRRHIDGGEHVSVIAEDRWQLPGSAQNVLFEGDASGYYARVIEGGYFPHTMADNFARRLVNAHGAVPEYQMILRPSFGEDDFESWGEDAPAARPKFFVERSVGRGAANNPEDVLRTKARLKELGFDWFSATSEVDDGFVWAIAMFQAIKGRTNNPETLLKSGSRTVDGRIDSGGNTERWLQAINAPRWERLEDGGPTVGWTFNADKENVPDRWGVNWLTDTIRSAGARYLDLCGGDLTGKVPLTVFELSHPRGGKSPPHKSHQLGLDVDIRLPRKDRLGDGGVGGVIYDDRQFDRELAYNVAAALLAQPRVKVLFFNDPALVNDRVLNPDGRIKRLDGHCNHMHASISPPEIGPQEMEAPRFAVQSTSTSANDVSSRINGWLPDLPSMTDLKSWIW